MQILRTSASFTPCLTVMPCFPRQCSQSSLEAVPRRCSVDSRFNSMTLFWLLSLLLSNPGPQRECCSQLGKCCSQLLVLFSMEIIWVPAGFGRFASRQAFLHFFPHEVIWDAVALSVKSLGKASKWTADAVGTLVIFRCHVNSPLHHLNGDRASFQGTVVTKGGVTCFTNLLCCFLLCFVFFFKI